MSHVVRYNSADPGDVWPDVLASLKSWYGDLFEVMEYQAGRVSDPRKFEFVCVFTGVRGYPVRIWYEHLHCQPFVIEPDQEEQRQCGTQMRCGPLSTLGYTGPCTV